MLPYSIASLLCVNTIAEVSTFLVTTSFVKCMELMKTNRIKRIFLPVRTIDNAETNITAFDLACSLSHFPHHRNTPLVLVLDVGEELTEDQEQKMAMYPFLGALRMPLHTRDFIKFL